MGIGALSAVASGVQVAGSLYSGYEQNQSAKKTARELKAEADYLAQQKREETEGVVQKQKMSYIKSGIELTPDSPLLMLADTRRKGYEEARRIQDRGYKQARNIRNQGRQALIGSVFNATGSGLQGYASYKSYGK
jgi:vacuolar-type H+-ATPase subunit H